MHRGDHDQRRSDKCLFANNRQYRGVSYREVWEKSGSGSDFEAWLENENGPLEAFLSKPHRTI
ncbi:hypothetical protein [Pararhizobium sp. IMCC21322]|uniref:hypothetical protein n=1 Tax=Pararhizobium sp. IMCC21322 TaxID=3067903 RepID=UPI002741AF4B|nr:hypothetical protein [Pararhizobium sp. IMCC21322]